MSSPEPNEEKLARFAEALRNADQNQRVFVPPTLDEAILKAARQQVSAPARARRLRLFAWITVAGAVAVIALAMLALPQTKLRGFARGDLNRDGRVDILDVLILAKTLETGWPPSKFDQNGDGKVDDADVRALASAVVRLNPQS